MDRAVKVKSIATPEFELRILLQEFDALPTESIRDKFAPFNDLNFNANGANRICRSRGSSVIFTFDFGDGQSVAVKGRMEKFPRYRMVTSASHGYTSPRYLMVASVTHVYTRGKKQL